VEALGAQSAYELQYRRWKQTHEAVFRRIALVVRHNESLDFFNLDLNAGRFSRADWPPDWGGMRDRLTRRLQGEPTRFEPLSGEQMLIEMPRFGEVRGPGTPESDWLVAELDLSHVRDRMLPDFLDRYLGDAGKLNYDAEVVLTADSARIIYSSPGGFGRGEDASVRLLDIGFPGPRRVFRGGPRELGRFGMRGGPPPLPDSLAGTPGGPGLWLLRVRHHAGSLEALVAQARRRNLAVSAGILLLLVVTAALLVRSSRRVQRLAELQMNFVAGVSHELRTPLAVIATAAYNLRGKFAQNSAHVEQYGKLIRDEAAKLGGLVEQILQFAGAQAGHSIRKLEPLTIETLLARALEGFRTTPDLADVVVEKEVQPDLPPLMADPAAMNQALRNLLDNAVRHGNNGKPWIGISAALASGETPAIEIAIADRGPGLPLNEQKHVFDPFFRGRRALDEQIHGTGLGLNLVKSIVGAHRGSIRVNSAPGRGAVFILRLPAAPAGITHELAHSAG